MSILGGIPYDTYLKSIAGVDWFMTQELSGSVAYATNSGLALGRRLNTQTYAAYVAGAGWSNPSAQLATHAAAGGTATLAHAGILAIGKTFEVVTIISGRTAGSVILTGTGAVAMTVDATYTDNITALGTALTYTPTDDFDGTINCATVTVKQTGILASSEYPPGTNPMDGTYTSVTLGGVADGNLGYAPLWDGTNDYLNIYSTELNSKFNPAAGTLIAFAKVSGAGIWTDGIIRVVCRLAADSSNQIFIWKDTANNTLLFRYEAANIVEDISVGSITSTDYLLVAMTWEKPGNMIAYINGVAVGTPQAIGGTWVGNLASDTAVIGALTTAPSNVWSGYETRIGIGYRALSAIEIADIYAGAQI